MNFIQGFAAFLMLMTSCLIPLHAADTQSADIASINSDATHAQNEQQQQQSLELSSLSQFPEYFQSLRSAIENNEFPGEKRGSPMFVGKKRGSPMFVGKKRASPMFVGKKRASPMFVGKKRASPMFVGKKRASPMFVGKKASPMFVGKKRGSPMFVGKKRASPMFVGKKRASPMFVGKKRASPMFVGKKRAQETSDESMDEMERDSRGSQRFEGKRARETVSSGTETDYHHIARREVPYFVGKRRAPLFVGKRAYRYSARGAPFFIGKRFGLFSPSVSSSSSPYLSAEEFKGAFRRSDPYFMGKRDSGFDDDKRGAPRFVGKRGSPLFVGRRGAPKFVGRRASPLFIGRRGAPKFVGRRGSPLFIGKRGAPKFVGKRGAPLFVGKRIAPLNPENFEMEEDDFFDGETDGNDFNGYYDQNDEEFSSSTFATKPEADNLITREEFTDSDFSKLLEAFSRLKAIKDIRKRIQNEKRIWVPGMVGRRSQGQDIDEEEKRR